MKNVVKQNTVILSRQDEIIREVAQRHGIPIMKAVEAWESYVKTIKKIIVDDNHQEDGLFVPDKYKTVCVLGLGRFYPNVKYMNKMNEIRIEKRKNKDNGSKSGE